MRRPKKNAALPDQVAAGLADRGFRIESDVPAALRDDLPSLIATLREWFDEEGIEPTNDDLPSPNLTPRERERASHLATLLAWYARALVEDPERSDEGLAEAEGAIAEGLDWARLAGDARREVHQHSVASLLHQLERDIDEEIDALEQGVAVAARGGDIESEVLMLGLLAATSISVDRIDTARRAVDRAFELMTERIDESRHPDFEIDLLVSRGRLQSKAGNEKEAIATFERARTLAESIDPHHPALTQVFLNFAPIYLGFEDRRKALEIYSAAVRVAEKNKDIAGMIWSHLHISTLHLSFADIDLMERALDIAERLSPQIPTTFHLEYLYTRRIAQYLKQKDYERALAYGQRMIDEFSEIDISPMVPVAHFNIGQVHLALGDEAKAEQSWRTALELNERLAGAEPPYVAWFALADLLMRSDRGDEAMEILDQIEERFEREEIPDIKQSKLLQLRALHAENQGDLQSALELTREAHAHIVAFHRRENDASVERARIRNEVDLAEVRAELEKAQRVQAEKSLAEALTAFEAKKSALAEIETQLRETLAVLDSSRAREVIGMLKTAIENIDETSGESAGASLHYLQTSDPAFFERLRERYPDLTHKQQQFCGLLRSGLSSKEIAAALGISSEGIRSQRKRLRKRLGLKKEEKLEGVLFEV